MRLSPVLLTAVAITTYAGIQFEANAQTSIESAKENQQNKTQNKTQNTTSVVGVSPRLKTFGKTSTVILPVSRKNWVVPPTDLKRSEKKSENQLSLKTGKSIIGSVREPVKNKSSQRLVTALKNKQQNKACKSCLISSSNKSIKQSSTGLVLPSPTIQKQETRTGRTLQFLTPKQNVSGSKTAQNFPPETTPEPTPETTPQQTPPPGSDSNTAPAENRQQLPQQTVPEQTSPQQTVPQQTVPEQTSPQQTSPQQTVPQQTSPEQKPPQTGVPDSNDTEKTSPEAETRVLVSEVLVTAESGEVSRDLENQVYRVVNTQPGRTTTRSQLQQDINAIFSTGFFSNVRAVPEDTPLGVRVSFIVTPNPVLSKVTINANPGTDVASVLPPEEVDKIFSPQYGKILNLRELQESIKQLKKVYQDKGYVLANVVGAPQVSSNGTVTLQVAEGVVEEINVKFKNKEGEFTDDKGKPIKGRTQKYIVTREMELKPGQVFNRNTVQKDLQRVFGLGVFEDINLSLDPGTDPTKVKVSVNVAERNSGSIAAGAGISSASGLFGTVSYQEQNLNGRTQKLGTEVQAGARGDLLFDLRFTDPWIAGDPYRTSYTVNAFRRRSISLIFDGDDNDRTEIVNGTDLDVNNEIQTLNDDLTEGDRPRVIRLGGGVNFTRPLSKNPYKRSEWVASAGLQYQRVSIRDSDGDLRPEGALFGEDVDGNEIEIPNTRVPLSESDKGQDDLFLVRLGATRDKRNSTLQPTKGSFLRLGVDQSVPLGRGNIFLTRLRGSYSRYFPVNFTNFKKGPETLAFNLQGGTILGDLPPYEAFSLGGSNSVRGYDEGSLGSGRSYVQASVEYRFPLISIINAAVFADFGSDLGTETRAAEVLDKNGTGFGYGIGVRVQSPLGPIRVDYGLNDDGESRINFGIGERF
ncbi:MAG: BamA/TamA family outer membrane protein [Cyanobacteria bacterium P01_A01_bin.84]